MEDLSPIKPVVAIKRNLTEDFSESESETEKEAEVNTSFPEESRRKNSNLTFGLEDVTPILDRGISNKVSLFFIFSRKVYFSKSKGKSPYYTDCSKNDILGLEDL